MGLVLQFEGDNCQAWDMVAQLVQWLGYGMEGGGISVTLSPRAATFVYCISFIWVIRQWRPCQIFLEPDSSEYAGEVLGSRRGSRISDMTLNQDAFFSPLSFLQFFWSSELLPLNPKWTLDPAFTGQGHAFTSVIVFSRTAMSRALSTGFTEISQEPSKSPVRPRRILTFCWPCISVYLSQYLTNLMHKICFTISFISCLYTFRAHVLIIRRSKLHYTASGIITPIGVMIPEAWNKT